jgi:Cu(I)/Ag(I) efflux system membrane fusion protein
MIQALEVRAGMTLAQGMTLAKVVGLATVWLEAAIPEAQTGLVAVGKPVEARFAAYPGNVLRGRVVAVLPEANAESRTVRVRVELANPGGRLRPGMFAQIRLDAGDAQPVLTVPTEALIRTGQRNVVIVANDNGGFQPVEVQPGREVQGRTAILSGLQPGQKVVSSGQFLIDSEASLRGVLDRLAPPAGAKP